MNTPSSFVDYITEWLHSQDEPEALPDSDYEQLKRQLKVADVLLIQGNSRVDDVLHKVTGSPWSHALLFLGRPIDITDPDVRNSVMSFTDASPDTPLLIRTTLHRGTHVIPLSDIEQFTVRICRPRSLSARDANQVARYAISRLAPKPRYLQLLDLLRFMLPWSLIPKRWRSLIFRYQPGRHARAGTASMISDAFGFIQYPILPLVKLSNDKGTGFYRRNLRMCLPTDIEQSPYFDIIKLTYLDFKQYRPAELLPWKGSGVLTADEAIRAFPPRDDRGKQDNVLAIKFRDQEES